MFLTSMHWKVGQDAPIGRTPGGKDPSGRVRSGCDTTPSIVRAVKREIISRDVDASLMEWVSPRSLQAAGVTEVLGRRQRCDLAEVADAPDRRGGGRASHQGVRCSAGSSAVAAGSVGQEIPLVGMRGANFLGKRRPCDSW